MSDLTGVGILGGKHYENKCCSQFGQFNNAFIFFCHRKDHYYPRKKTILTHKLNANTCSVRLYLQLSVGGFMSYLRYLCLLAYSGVQHILCYVFVLFFLRVVYPMLSVSLDCPYWYSLTFI